MAKSNQIQGTAGSIFTKRQRMAGAKKDGGGKQMKRRGVFATVTNPDPKPGWQSSTPAGLLPQLRCPVPATRRQRYHLGAKGLAA